MAKIIFLVTQSEMGGAQRYIYEVARGLNPEKYEILVAAGSPAFAKASAGKEGNGELFKKLENTQVQPVYLKQMTRTPWPWQIFLAVREIYNLLKKEKPDVLFLCSTTAGLLGSIAGFIYKKIYGSQTSIIYRIGGWAFRDPRPFWQNWLILLAEKLTAPLKDKIIVNSEIGRKVALKYGIAPAEKIIKIYNGLDANSLDFLSKEEARNRLNNLRGCLNSNNLVSYLMVGTVANFYKTKGLKYLIEAVTKQDFVTVIIGEGRLRPKLEAQIKKLGLENKVFLVGRIPDAYKYLKAFDVFVLPSLKEGFPWVILEAMAAEIPIVATNVGVMPEILDEEFLVEPKNSEILAKKIGLMLKHPAKTKLKQEFTSKKMIEETEKLFSQ